MKNNNIDHQSDLGDNPEKNIFNVSVSVPENIRIRMVDASTLSDYEIWAFISSLLSNCAVGMWVWAGQNENLNLEDLLVIFSSILTLLLVVSIIVMIIKRKKLNQSSKTIKI